MTAVSCSSQSLMILIWWLVDLSYTWSGFRDILCCGLSIISSHYETAVETRPLQVICLNYVGNVTCKVSFCLPLADGKRRRKRKKKFPICSHFVELSNGVLLYFLRDLQAVCHWESTEQWHCKYFLFCFSVLRKMRWCVWISFNTAKTPCVLGKNKSLQSI